MRPPDILAFSLAPLLPLAAAQDGPPRPLQVGEPRAFDVLDGGDFERPFFPEAEARLGTGVPFWRTLAGRPMLVAEGDGQILVLEQGAAVSQPVFAAGPWVERMTVSGRVRGTARLQLADATGRAVAAPIGGGDGWTDFAFTVGELCADAVDPPRPRFELRLASGAEPVAFDDVRVVLELPTLPAEAQRAEVLAAARWIFDLWLERGLDDEGERPTGFCTRVFDVRTGERLDMRAPGCVHVLFEAMLTGYGVFEDERYRTALATYLDDLIELGLHPETGLPQYWDGALDRGLPEKDMEIARTLRFLLRAADSGPPAQRAAAEEAAIRIGEWVLARGELPNGEVAGSYVPGSGRPSARVPGLRGLDVPAELVALTARSGDRRYADAAERALATFEYLHLWAGTWDSIDPGWDDEYGHIGARSTRMAALLPDEPHLARLAESGADYFGPRWERTLAHGGFVAADQVRSWRVLADLARVRPERLARTSELLDLALRQHLKGEQDTVGAWVDVSHHRWDPKLKLEVGDLPGAPANLLRGIALCRRQELDIDPAWLDAVLLTTLRATFADYGAPYGLLPTRPASEGTNPSGASLRILVALVEWLTNA